MSVQSDWLEVRQLDQLITDHSLWFVGAQPNLSIHGADAKPTKFVSSSDRLHSCFDRRHASTDDPDQVRSFAFRPFDQSSLTCRCVIWTLCEPNMEFQRVNPTTQVALASECVGDCTTLRNITWNVYCSTGNSASNQTTWTLFNQSTAHAKAWFFGM